jgi:hypothetical protein
MPSWVSKHSEPGRKIDLFERRLCRLRGAVKRGESLQQLVSNAEKVRLAALAVIKAKRALIKEYPQRDPSGRQSRNLQVEEERWLSLSPEAIIEEYGNQVS